jgi:hypothetical protein
MTKLTLDIIEKYNLPKSNWNPDWDDSGYMFTLPSGIEVSGLYRCNNVPTEMDGLEGLDGYVYIDSEEMLVEYIGMSLDDTFEKIKKENPKFNAEDYE